MFVLLLTLCSIAAPASAAPVPVPLAQVARPAETTTPPNASTSVPPGNAKKGFRLGPLFLALPAVAVLAAAVATPLALRRYRERAARHRTEDQS